jgi:hypothetical protein
MFFIETSQLVQPTQVLLLSLDASSTFRMVLVAKISFSLSLRFAAVCSYHLACLTGITVLQAAAV